MDCCGELTGSDREKVFCLFVNAPVPLPCQSRHWIEPHVRKSLREGHTMMDSSRSPSPALAGLRVMIVEDHWHLMEALQLIIEKAGGVMVGAAATIDQAEQLVETVGFDAAVMDLNLQNEMATPLVERLADDGVKVVLVTAYEVPPKLAAKVHAVLRKPTPADALIEALALPLRPA